jgi:quercetin dioxygenase-like cupin family protein
VRTVRARQGETIDFPAYDGELVFGFVLDGSAALQFGGSHDVSAADAFVIPPGEPLHLSGISPDFRLLHVTTSRLG